MSGAERGGIRLWMLVFLLMIVAFLSFVLTSAFAGNPLLAKFAVLERTPPEITLAREPRGFGAQSRDLRFTVQDSGAGVDEVIVRLVQKHVSKELLKRSFDPPVKSEELSVPVDARELGLKETDVQITITAFDRSMWSNGAVKEISVPVDFSKPRIEVVTSQHNAARGGAELVFYKVTGKTIERDGVEVGKRFYPGYPASELDEAFKSVPDLRFAFFAIPVDFDAAKDRIHVAAYDSLDNMASSEFYHTIKERKFTDPAMQITDEFVKTKVAYLLPEYRALAKRAGRPEPQVSSDPRTQDEEIALFRAINEDLRGLLEDRLRGELLGKERKRYWSGVFQRPLSAAPRATFAERRRYDLDGKSAGSAMHMGIDLAATANSVVRSAAAGKVVFADDFGIYGRTVLVDHGFGLVSLYGHLSSILCNVGDELSAGADVGRTGTTGLALGDHLHFELRLHGTPITPIEWWDAKWISDHIDGKIQSVKTDGPAPQN